LEYAPTSQKSPFVSPSDRVGSLDAEVGRMAPEVRLKDLPVPTLVLPAPLRGPD